MADTLSQTHAFKYVGTTMTDLGTLGGDTSSAYGVSGNGSIIVGASTLANGNTHAFSYTGTTMTDLGTLGGGTWSQATAISSNGNAIVGWSFIANGDLRAFKYVDGVMIDLGTLGGDSPLTQANAVNRDGTVIVGEAYTPTDWFRHAVMFKDGLVIDLGTLGGTYSIATGVSGDGTIVVGDSTIDPGTDLIHHGFAYRNGKMIDTDNTTADLVRSAGLVRHSMVQRSAALTQMTDYNCTVSSSNSFCVGYLGRLSNVGPRNDEGAGGIVLGYRLGQSWRVGGFVDYRGAQTKANGIDYGNDTPSFGGFVGFDQNGDRTGLQARVAGAINRGGVTVSRLGELSNTEAGAGTSTLTSRAFSGQVNWGVRVGDRLIASPFAGVRYVESKLEAYSEAQTDQVEFPISYGAYKQRTTFAVMGMKLDGYLTDKLGFNMEVGGEYNLRSATSNYTGTSDIPQLSQFSIASEAPARIVRPRGSVGLSYDVMANQRAGLRVSAQTLPFSSTVARTMLGSYEVGF